METLFYFFCTSLPHHLLAFLLFWNFHWFSKKIAAVLAAANVLFKLSLIYWVSLHGGNIRLVEIVFSVSGIAIYLFNIQISHSKLIFTYLLATDYLIIIRGLSSFLAEKLLPLQSWQSGLFYLLLYLLFLLLLIFFRPRLEALYRIHAPSLWRIMCFIPALTTLMVLIFTDPFSKESVGNWTFLFTRMILLACVLTISLMLIQSLHRFQKQTILEERAKQMEQILSLQRSQYSRLQEHIEETRRARHDLKQHLKIIQSYLSNGNQKALQNYIDAYGMSLPPDTVRQYCKNYALDTLLRYYAEQLTDMGVDLELEIDLPQKLKVSDPDLCVIFGNLLENALEACADQKDPYVRAAAHLTGEHAIALIVDNTSPVSPKLQEDGSFLSTKHSGSGIGTQSVKGVAARYNGTADFRWESGMFYASVLLNPSRE